VNVARSSVGDLASPTRVLATVMLGVAAHVHVIDEAPLLVRAIR